MNILILCTGNSCRSQMGELLMQSYDSRLKVHSAGTEPSKSVHPMAVEVMKEIGFDLSQHKTKQVNDFLDTDLDFLITVCSEAEENCPSFFGKVKHQVHIGFDDPATVKGDNSFKLEAFRRIRDEINTELQKFFKLVVLPELA